MPNKGFFILTDISGYTEFLTESELEHAHQALQALFDAQIKNINFPLKISGFRGDAIFMYTPEMGMVNRQSFIETLENLYIIFTDTAILMQANTTCPCRACINIKKLDLKMCIHYGEYLIQTLGDREELLGADVIVPHRMLKNHVIEQTGIKSYALFSEAAAQALDLHNLCTPLTAHKESYEHIGEVNMLVHNLRAAWEKEKDKHRIFVTAEEAWVRTEVELPYPAPLIWRYLTTPSLEAGFLQYDYAERVDDLGGRAGESSKFHCAHGDMHVYSKVLDWKPFEYYTMEQTVLGLNYIQTRRLTPTENGTRVGIYLDMPKENPNKETHDFVQSSVDAGYANLGTFIEQDIANGNVKIE